MQYFILRNKIVIEAPDNWRECVDEWSKTEQAHERDNDWCASFCNPGFCCKEKYARGFRVISGTPEEDKSTAPYIYFTISRFDSRCIPYSVKYIHEAVKPSHIRGATYKYDVVEIFKTKEEAVAFIFVGDLDE